MMFVGIQHGSIEREGSDPFSKVQLNFVADQEAVDALWNLMFGLAAQKAESKQVAPEIPVDVTKVKQIICNHHGTLRCDECGKLIKNKKGA